MSRERMERLARLLAEASLRERRRRQACRGGLIEFIRCFWHILEPQTALVEGPALDAICLHLEAVTYGEITRLLINVPPGFMKSLVTNVFWPAWEWGPMGLPHHRYVTFSYAASLTLRDNGRFRDLLVSPEYQELWGDAFELRKIGEEKVSNDQTGWKLASSVGGVGTGERGTRILLDDAHSVKETESTVVREETVRWFREAMSNRLNDMRTDVIIAIMQRTHAGDVSGCILDNEMGYTHLMIPMEYDPARHCETEIGWSDWRSDDGELAWPERFPAPIVDDMKRDLGPYAYAGQYQQRPVPRGGAIFKEEWWQLWAPDDGKFPEFEYLVASVDTAYTAKEENDPSGLTVWGVFRNELDQPRIMLVHAWRKRLEFQGPLIERAANESQAAYLKRAQPHWGLIEWVSHTCRRFRVDKLLVEAKASGISVAQAIRKIYVNDDWGTEAVPVVGDKVSRAHAVVHLFSQELVYAPEREWAALVIEEMGAFPKFHYRDLTDSATQALKHLRDIGLAVRRDEEAAEREERLRYRKPSAPLYPV